MPQLPALFPGCWSGHQSLAASRSLLEASTSWCFAFVVSDERIVGKALVTETESTALLLEMQREGGEGGRHGLLRHQEIRNVKTQMLSVPSSVCLLITEPRKVMLRAGSGTCDSYLHSISRAIYKQELGSYCPLLYNCGNWVQRGRAVLGPHEGRLQVPCLKLLCSAGLAQPPDNLGESQRSRSQKRPCHSVLLLPAEMAEPRTKDAAKIQKPSWNIVILLANTSWRRREYVYFIRIDGPRTSHNRFSRCAWLRGETINAWEAER